MVDFKYRPDVDGLRAVAVMLVLLFHAGLGFPGGFIGVDVFFVISGFLITGLIIKDLESGTFSLTDFWVRRIRRIIPAASAMVIVVLIAGYLLLLPSEFSELGKSAAAQQFVLSNVFFWRNTGYFDGPSDYKPLLHTWSLAVEEQFYLVYPFLLMLLSRFGQQKMWIPLGSIALGSFVLSQIGVSRFPSATFFLLPTRAWELLIGGLLWFLPRHHKTLTLHSEWLSWICLLSILAVGCLYTSQTPFPGAAAFIPCAATAMLIYLNAHQLSRPGRILACKPMVDLGKISYSLYLWHWPILAFGKSMLSSFGKTEGFIALLLSLPVAVLSWRYIETCFRKGARSIRPSRVVLSALAGTLLVGGIGYEINREEGMAFRIPRPARDYLDAKRPRYFLDVVQKQVEEGSLPTWGTPQSSVKELLLWGDSHAQSIAAGLVAACIDQQCVLYQATHTNTPPLLDFDSSHIHPGQESPSYNKAVLELAQDKKIDMAFLCASWAKYSVLPGFEDSFQKTVQSLRFAGVDVVIVLDYPCGPRMSPNLAVREILGGADPETIGVTQQDHQKKNHNVNRIFAKYRSLPIRFADPAPVFLNESGIFGFMSGGKSLYYDGTHLTESGGLHLVDFFTGLIASYTPPSVPELQE